jgi:mannitol operon transcriptional antiterminator
LAIHLSRTLRRLRGQFTIRNPLLAEIREQYPRLFASARAAADRVFSSVRLPDTEIGFLVLHLGSSLLRRRRRLLVVCPTGLGTSNMLSARLRGELPEADVVGVLPVSEISRVDPASYDLILSTVALDLPRERYLVVSPLLPPRDIARILAAFGRDAGPARPGLPGPCAAAVGADTL